MAIEDGGPAFPCDHLVDDDGISLASGISMRDYFAAKALTALITGRSWGHIKDSDEGLVDIWASGAYKLADAMLKARSK